MTGIYLERDGELVNLSVEPFGSEDEFQSLIEHHGQLLAGDQINRSSPRRFLLVRREAGIPSEATGSDRWSVDHLFIDQDAVPTVVEVKRSTDTRIRREVVGQMLDYAANASVHWPEGRLRSEFETTSSKAACDPAERLADLLGPSDESEDDAAEAFWRQADANLRSGRMRLLFVADEIPVELQRIIEFLNERMTPTEVLGIEVRRYAGGGLRAMIPSVVGQTAAARSTKRSSNGDLGSHHRARFQYWTRLLEIAGDRATLFSTAKPNRSPYLSLGAGITGVSYQYWVRQEAAHIVLWIDRGKDQHHVNESFFRQLVAHREVIEAAHGGPLEWNEMEDAQSSKIVRAVPEAPGWASDPETWKPGMIAMVDAMESFHGALAPHVKNLDPSLAEGPTS